MNKFVFYYGNTYVNSDTNSEVNVSDLLSASFSCLTVDTIILNPSEPVEHNYIETSAGTMSGRNRTRKKGDLELVPIRFETGMSLFDSINSMVNSRYQYLRDLRQSELTNETPYVYPITSAITKALDIVITSNPIDPQPPLKFPKINYIARKVKAQT